MLEHTFVHIPGIGRRTERVLWQAGITSWDDLEGFAAGSAAISLTLRQRLETYVPQSIQAIETRNAAFFARLSGLGEAWRLFPEFERECVFLDIETTGLSPIFDTVTMVGLFDGHRYAAFIEGNNLQDLPDQLKRYSVVVTFNGSGFDLRFLKLAFKNLELPPIHIDLRWVTRRLGYRGGLKSIERQFGICRDPSIEDLNGHEATILWSRHLRGDRAALEQLIAYNSEDVVHLKAIMEIAYDRLADQVSGPFGKRKKIYGGVGAVPKAPKFRKQPTVHTSRTLVAKLLERSDIAAPKIVGIDLTGSERRATGWALLNGFQAETKSIITDTELIEETVAAKPNIVSIDSPLSVPAGWNRAQRRIADGSPIYRKCELALKRMGVSVFWCLLPSMQSLTMRGMRLAQDLRDRGLQVIESYPGAAQDILGIPRKGASLEELKWGLNRAGIEGRYLNDRVTHDEVDAITSALVGLFYIADDYIALGNPTEDYLIVPRSPKINYSKLAEILAKTGLDELTTGTTDRLECKLHAKPAAIQAFPA